MKKLRIIEIAIMIIFIRLTPTVIQYTDATRGYKAYGSEYLLPFFALLIVFAIETALEIISEMKKGQNDA